VFLAGLYILGGESIDAHEDFGYTVMHLLPLLMIVLAFVGKMGRLAIGLTILLLVIVFIQPLWLDDEKAAAIEAVHPTMALLIFGLGIDLMRRGLGSLKGAPATA
jgi:hypothetical protein